MAQLTWERLLKTPSVGLARPDRGWEAWKFGLAAATLGHVIVLSAAYGASAVLPPLLHVHPYSGLALWPHFDAELFIHVARQGYSSARVGPFSNLQALFPLFPLLIRGLAPAVGPIVAGLVIAFIATVVSCAFLYELAEESLGEGTGPRAVLYLVLFPTALFLVAPYSEALFLAGGVGAFLFARRGRWVLSGIAAAIAVGTRVAGVFVLIGLVVEFLRGRRFSPRDIRRAGAGLAIAILPLLAYGAYLWRTQGSPVYFLTAERLGWQRTFVGPVASFTKTWGRLVGRHQIFPSLPWAVHDTLIWAGELTGAALCVTVTVWCILRREWGWAAFVGTTTLALITSTGYLSIPRMLLSLFPVTLFFADVTRGRPKLHVGLLASFTVALCVGTILFTQNIWFY
jgi:hypothetical protein